MKAIETTVTVHPGGHATLQMPTDLPPGEHSVLVILREHHNERPSWSSLELPLHDCGPWPTDLSLTREVLYGDDGR
jgi:hypothetical protein